MPKLLGPALVAAACDPMRCLVMSLDRGHSVLHAMATPQFVNAPTDAAAESLAGLLLQRPDLTTLPEAPNVVVRRSCPTGAVSLICGGGSGHEPAHAAFVGSGHLTAAVCGAVYASPSHASVLAAIRHVRRHNGGMPVLVLIKNYGGDVINFTYAATVADAEFGKKGDIATFVIGDDVAFGAHHNGQRGIAGTVLLYSILGGLADAGASLPYLLSAATALASRMRSVGVALTACSVPGNPPTAAIPAGHYSLGMGIHGEAGKETLPLEPADAVVRRMWRVLASPPAPPPEAGPPTLPPPAALQPDGPAPVADPAAPWVFDAAEPGAENAVVLFVNNLGACADVEVGLVSRGYKYAFGSLFRNPNPYPGNTLATSQM